MASTVSNTAQSAVAHEEIAAEEPSMEEILASIKKIIADDEEAADGRSARERYTHPTDHSNSNVADDDVEEQLRLAMESEMHQLAGGTDEPVAVAPAIVAAASQVKSSVAEKTVQSVEERAARIRAEVAAAGQGLSSDERLEKYRMRSQLKMEALVAERAEQRAAAEAAAQEKAKAEVARPSQNAAPAPRPAAAGSPSADSKPVQPVFSPGLQQASPAFQPFVPNQAPAQVSAQTITAMPSAKDVASEMASKLMSEQGSEIHAMLSEFMRPTIRQWLTDNLPSLVEKLVREEIERVSRGKKAS